MSGAGSAFERPIRIEYRPSAHVVIALLVMHLGAFAAVALSGLTVAAKLALCTLIAGALFVQSRRISREILGSEPPILQLDGRDRWWLLRPGGSDRMTIGSDTVALPWLVVLHLRDAAQASRFFVLTPANVSRDVLRRLCVRLRYPLSPD